MKPTHRPFTAPDPSRPLHNRFKAPAACLHKARAEFEQKQRLAHGFIDVVAIEFGD